MFNSKLKIILIVSALFLAKSIDSNPLDDYVNDNSDIKIVKYEIKEVKNHIFYVTYRLNFTSLVWFDEKLSDRSVWWHDVYINIPLKMKPCQPSLFFILDGINNVTDNKDQYLDYIEKQSVNCSCITVGMKQIPNQPITFMDDPKATKRVEDAIIGYTFKLFREKAKDYPRTYQYLPLLFPMAKAVKRGMDMVQSFSQSIRVQKPEKFILSGISKRGWTTFLASAINYRRVIGFIPIVYDLIDINKNLHVQYQALNGAYSFALKDYYEANMTLLADALISYNLANLIDPKYYFERYQNQKVMLILASSDEFMMQENTKAFFKDLSIQTNSNAFIRRLPNSNHYLVFQADKIFANINNFYNIITKSTENNSLWPKVTWKFANNKTHGVIEMTLSNLKYFDSVQINGFSALSVDRNRKDFRQNTLSQNFQIKLQNITWQTEKIKESFNLSSPLQTSDQPLKYSYAISRSLYQDQYIGFFMQASLKLKRYPFRNSFNEEDYFIVSSETNVIPEYNPIGDCDGFECLGTLV